LTVHSSLAAEESILDGGGMRPGRSSPEDFLAAKPVLKIAARSKSLLFGDGGFSLALLVSHAKSVQAHTYVKEPWSKHGQPCS
jgi:hypothetical protein